MSTGDSCECKERKINVGSLVWLFDIASSLNFQIYFIFEGWGIDYFKGFWRAPPGAWEGVWNESGYWRLQSWRAFSCAWAISPGIFVFDEAASEAGNFLWISNQWITNTLSYLFSSFRPKRQRQNNFSMFPSPKAWNFRGVSVFPGCVLVSKLQRGPFFRVTLNQSPLRKLLCFTLGKSYLHQWLWFN